MSEIKHPTQEATVSNTNLVLVSAEEQDTLVRKSIREAISADIDALVTLGSQKLTTVEDKDAYNKVRGDLATLRDTRVAIEKRRKDLKQPYLEAGRTIDAVAKEIIEKLAPAEDSLKDQVAWFDDEVDRRKKAMIESRISQLEATGFEKSVNLDDDSETWIVGDVSVAGSSLGRLGDERFERILRKGAKAKAAILAEQERLRREEEERKRQEEREAKLAAEQAPEPSEEVATPEPVQPKPKTFTNPLGREVPVEDPEPAPQAPEPKPELSAERIEAIEEAVTALEAAYHPDVTLYVRRLPGRSYFEVCLFYGAPTGETLPIPDRVISIPIHRIVS